MMLGDLNESIFSLVFIIQLNDIPKIGFPANLGKVNFQIKNGFIMIPRALQMDYILFL